MTHYERWLELDHTTRAKKIDNITLTLKRWVKDGALVDMRLSWWADLCESKTNPKQIAEG